MTSSMTSSQLMHAQLLRFQPEPGHLDLTSINCWLCFFLYFPSNMYSYRHLWPFT